MRLPLSTALLALLASATSLAAPAAAQSDVDVDTISPKPYPNRVLLIRHGEKPKDGGVGLSRAGRKRAQCVRKVSRPVFFFLFPMRSWAFPCPNFLGARGSVRLIGA